MLCSCSCQVSARLLPFADEVSHGLDVSGVTGIGQAVEVQSILGCLEQRVMVVGGERRPCTSLTRDDQCQHVAATLARHGIAAATIIAKAVESRARAIRLIPGDEDHGA